MSQSLLSLNSKEEKDVAFIIYKGMTYFMQSPEGPLEVTVLEDDRGNPIRILCHCGKAGSGLMAWIDAFCRIISIQMEKGALKINDIMDELSSTTSDHVIHDAATGITISSGPEAVFIALCKYQNDKYEELNNKLKSKEIGYMARSGER